MLAAAVCVNHPDSPADDRCTGCAEGFCGNCLVAIAGVRYCASCKTMAVKDGGHVLEAATVPCAEADQGFWMALVGVFLFGFVLGPLAIRSGLAAREKIRRFPRLAGWGRAQAAIVVGAIAFVFWALNMAAQLSGL